VTEEKAKTDTAIDQQLIRDLADLLRETELSEIEIEQAGLRLRVARQISAAPVAAMAAAAATATAPAASEPVSDLANHPGAVASPMVGTVYVAPEPSEPPFVKVGDTVSEGQTLLIVEAMKTMNQIPAPKSGRIAQILISNGQPVEYGEPLIIIE
jgi:acetyl-CoA carboxylase biotin carboxyl carrier protein